MDVIDLTSKEKPANNIEAVDLTMEVNPERLADFRQRVLLAFNKYRNKQNMSLLRLTKNINSGNRDKYSEMEINSALFQMADANQINILNGIVYLI